LRALACAKFVQQRRASERRVKWLGACPFLSTFER
jgi:hypothetical protein